MLSKIFLQYINLTFQQKKQIELNKKRFKTSNLIFVYLLRKVNKKDLNKFDLKFKSFRVIEFL